MVRKTKVPIISVNIPLITGGNNEIVIRALKKINYPKSSVEVIIVEGKQIAKQRNIALKYSNGDILYLLDNDSVIKRNSFNILATEFKNPKVAAVGGPSLTKKNGGYFNQLVGYVLETYFGAMRMKFRYSQQNTKAGSEYRLIGANLALRKDAVIKAGGFNESIVPNEETELLRRLTRKGYILKYNKSLVIYRENRKNIFDLAKQFHHYGIGRMKQIKCVFIKEDFIFLLLILFLLYIISLLFYHPNFYFTPLFVYFAAGMATSIKATFKYKKPDLLISMPLIFPVIHISYILGLIREFIKPINRNHKNATEEDYVTNVKIYNLNPVSKIKLLYEN